MKTVAAGQFSMRWVDLVRSKVNFFTLLQVICGSLFIGLCAQIKIPLPFTPVPLLGATFSTLLVGSLLGSRKGALAALLYVIEGSLGLPMWAGGAAGFLHLMGPTGGYRIAYILQAYLAGWFVERQSNIRFIRTSVALFLSCCLQMSVGALWLGYFVGLKNILIMGFLPFIPVEAVKTMLVAAYLKYTRSK